LFSINVLVKNKAQAILKVKRRSGSFPEIGLLFVALLLQNREQEVGKKYGNDIQHTDL